ncbi:MAG: Hg(II)-responsive transcriptional regulator [Planctomycetaceae bacterium]
MKQTLTTGEVAQRAGVNVETVRYYERNGMLPEPTRRASGYRDYSHDAVLTIQFIKRAQRLGFSLREIRELLKLRLDPNEDCSLMKQHASQKLEDVQKKIADLRAMETVLKELIERCPGEGPLANCNILEFLNGENPK